MTRHALDCGLCCGLEKCDCGAEQKTPHYRPIAWASMPFAVRKAWLRYSKAVPAYDLSLTQGWEWFQPAKDAQHVYAINRSGDWYITEATESLVS